MLMVCWILTSILAMILATFLLTKVEIGAKVEAALQNFAAGLIISAGKVV